jgi:hypothetical protein
MEHQKHEAADGERIAPKVRWLPHLADPGFFVSAQPREAAIHSTHI